MALSGLVETALRAYFDANGTTHARLGGRAPLNLQGLREYMFGDSAAYLLAKTTGKGTFDWRVNPSEGDAMYPIGFGGERTAARTDNVETLSQRLQLYTKAVTMLDREVEIDQVATTLMSAGLTEAFFERIFENTERIWSEASVTIANSLERLTAALPNFDKMENRSLSCEAMTSYLALNNEWFAGLYGIITNTGISGGVAGTDFNNAVVGGKWTTKFGTNPNDSKWTQDGINKLIPLQLSYSSATATNVAGMLTMMVRASRDTNFKAPPMHTKHDSGIVEKGTAVDASVWNISSRGMDEIQAATIGTQDLWVRPSRQDPAVLEPTIAGIPIRIWYFLDTIAMYNSGTNDALATEGASTIRRGPRAYLHRRDSMFPVAHELNWMRQRNPPRFNKVPDAEVSYVDNELTWAGTDMRRQAVVFPSTTVIGAY